MRERATGLIVPNGRPCPRGESVMDSRRFSRWGQGWRRALAVWAAFQCALTAVAADVRIAGSDLLGSDLEVALQSFAARGKMPVRTDFSGSRAALDALKAGAADLAIVMLAPDEKLPVEGYAADPLAYRIAVVVAPQVVGLTQVSFIQLEGVFGASGPAGFRVWRDLGVTGNRAQLTVGTHVLSTKTDAVSADIFRHQALRVARFKPSVMRHEQMTTLVEKLAAEEGGLAILPEAPTSHAGLSVLLVSRAEGEPAFGPTPENIHTGDYPLRVPIWVVYRKGSLETLRPLLGFLWSDEAARILAESSYCVPVPSSGRPAIR
jgi:phosphate transport system substrate-binding protein